MNQDKKLIQSVMRSLDILEFIAANSNQCRLQEISTGLGLNKSTVHSLISTLEHRGYVLQNPDSPKYSLGINCMRLGIIYRRDFFAREQMNKMLTELSASIGETCYFAVRVGEQYFYLDAVAPDRSLKADAKIGAFVSLDRPTAISKAFHAAKTEGSAGYQIDLEEDECGINGMGVLVMKNNNPLGVIGIYGPSGRFNRQQMDNAYQELIKLQSVHQTKLVVR